MTGEKKKKKHFLPENNNGDSHAKQTSCGQKGSQKQFLNI